MKKWTNFFSGMLVMAMIVAMTGTALAASGSVLYNQAGITLFGRVEVEAGTTYKAANGQEVPSVITYVDEAGGKTNYLSVRQISELLDAEVSWNAATGNVEFAPVGDGGFTVTKWVEPPAVPVYGTVAGPFTEIDPKTVDTSGTPLVLMENSHTVSPTGCYTSGIFRPAGGNHIIFKVTNNGEAAQTVSISRPITVSNKGGESFTDVTLSPGQTLTRAFYLSDDASLLTSKLDFSVNGQPISQTTDVTMSLYQYK